jgi:hypothetical protein
MSNVQFQTYNNIYPENLLQKEVKMDRKLSDSDKNFIQKKHKSSKEAASRKCLLTVDKINNNQDIRERKASPSPAPNTRNKKF